jgi:hypothetical protein
MVFILDNKKFRLNLRTGVYVKTCMNADFCFGYVTLYDQEKTGTNFMKL